MLRDAHVYLQHKGCGHERCPIPLFGYSLDVLLVPVVEEKLRYVLRSRLGAALEE